MGGIGEVILLMALVFGGGYGYRMFDEPVTICKTINVTAPSEYTQGIEIEDCKQDTLNTDCPISYPRFVLSEKEYMKDIENGKGTRAYLNECLGVVTKYNKSKSVRR